MRDALRQPGVSCAQAADMRGSHPGVQAVPTAGKSAMGAASLFRWLNRTHTKCGARLLRANLLQPLTDVDTLKLRQVCGSASARDQGRVPSNMLKVRVLARTPWTSCLMARAIWCAGPQRRCKRCRATSTESAGVWHALETLFQCNCFACSKFLHMACAYAH